MMLLLLSKSKSSGPCQLPGGWAEGCPQPHFPESPDIFTSLLMRAVREQEPCNWAACESTQAPLCLQIWSRYRNEARVERSLWVHVNLRTLRKKWKILKQGPFAREPRMRDESRELRVQPLVWPLCRHSLSFQDDYGLCAQVLRSATHYNSLVCVCVYASLSNPSTFLVKHCDKGRPQLCACGCPRDKDTQICAHNC